MGLASQGASWQLGKEVAFVEMNQSSSLKPIFIWYAIQSTSPTWPFGDESLGKEEIGENNKLSIFVKLNLQNWRVAGIILFGKCNFHLRVKRVCITNKRKVISWLLYQVQKLLSCKKGREKASTHELEREAFCSSICRMGGSFLLTYICSAFSLFPASQIYYFDDGNQKIKQ